MTDNPDIEPVFEQIDRLCQLGQKDEDEKKFDRAIDKYLEALDLIPEPITDWDALTWILTAIGDIYFLLKDYPKSRQFLQDAMHCPNAIGNPFIHLRLGQVQYELEDFERAKDEFARALILGGSEIFEEEDPKYLQWIRPFLRNSNEL